MKLTEIENLAVQIAVDAADKRNQWSRSAYIRWELIERLRHQLEQEDIDWRKIKRAHHDRKSV